MNCDDCQNVKEFREVDYKARQIDIDPKSSIEVTTSCADYDRNYEV